MYCIPYYGWICVSCDFGPVRALSRQSLALPTRSISHLTRPSRPTRGIGRQGWKHNTTHIYTLRRKLYIWNDKTRYDRTVYGKYDTKCCRFVCCSVCVRNMVTRFDLLWICRSQIGQEIINTSNIYVWNNIFISSKKKSIDIYCLKLFKAVNPCNDRFFLGTLQINKVELLIIY